MPHMRLIRRTHRDSHLPSLICLLVLLTSVSSAQSIRHLEFDGPGSGPAVYTDTPGAKPQLQPGYSLNATADSTGVTDPRLIGFWEHRGPNGAITLEFISDSRLVFAGRHVTYALTDETIRVKDDVGYTDYAYRVRGDRLLLILKDSEQKDVEMQFQRVLDSGPDSDPQGAH